MGKFPKARHASFPSRLRLARVASGMDCKQLADTIGCDPSLTLRWESGEREPCLVHLSALSMVLGESCDWLLGVADAIRAAKGASDE